jgi:hypothetical protein
MRTSIQTLTAISAVVALLGCGFANSAASAHSDPMHAISPIRILRGPGHPAGFTPIRVWRGHEHAEGFIPVRTPYFCLSPAVMEHECVAWAPAPPNMLFGPCTKYAWVCQTPPRIQ